MAPGIPRESLGKELVEEDNGHPESMNFGKGSSASFREIQSANSIRSPVVAQGEVSGVDWSAAHLTQNLGADVSSNAIDRQPMRLADIYKETEHDWGTREGRSRDSSFVLRREENSISGHPPSFRHHDRASSPSDGPPLHPDRYLRPSSNIRKAPPRLQSSHVIPSGYIPQTLPPAPEPPQVPLKRAFTVQPEHEYSRSVENHRVARRRSSFDDEEDYLIPIQTTYNVNGLDRGIPRIIDTKYKDPYAAAPGVTFSKVKASPPYGAEPYGAEIVVTSRDYDEENVVNSDFNHMQPSYDFPRSLDRRITGLGDHLKPQLAKSDRKEGTSRPIKNNFWASCIKEDISITISRDSSADESVRQAKRLADMGERSQRMRSWNETKFSHSIERE